MKPAIFIDRDGTINIEKEYMYKKEDFEFISKSDKAIKLLKDKGFLVIIITNQSGIARGYYNEKELEILHDFLIKKLRKINTYVDAIYYCPHHPEKGIGKYKKDCDCRKPDIGMFNKAIKEFNIDINNSWMIGDKEDDMLFAEKAGIKKILVNTGYGKLVKKEYLRKDNLYEAVKYIIKNNQHKKMKGE